MARQKLENYWSGQSLRSVDFSYYLIEKRKPRILQSDNFKSLALLIGFGLLFTFSVNNFQSIIYLT